MPWVVVACLMASLVLSCAIGWQLGRRGHVAALSGALIALVAIGVRTFFRFRPDFEFPLLAWPLYGCVRDWFAYPFVFFLLGIGLARSSCLAFRAAVVACSIVLLLVAAQPALAEIWFDRQPFGGEVGQDGICRQTRDYTCGAAAAATLLSALGVSSDEREMAILCRTAPLTGTDEIAVSRGLLTKLREWGRVRVERPSSDRLRLLSGPAMARMKASFPRDHWVVILSADDRGVMLADPLVGRVLASPGEILKNWRGTLITVERASAVPIASR